MKINRIQFHKIKQQFEMLKLRGAFLLAQQEYDDQIRKEVDRELYYISGEQGMTPSQFKDMDDLLRHSTPVIDGWKIREYEDALLKMEEQGRKLLKEEKYELMNELKELYEQTKKELEQLRGNSRS